MTPFASTTRVKKLAPTVTLLRKSRHVTAKLDTVTRELSDSHAGAATV